MGHREVKGCAESTGIKEEILIFFSKMILHNSMVLDYCGGRKYHIELMTNPSKRITTQTPKDFKKP